MREVQNPKNGKMAEIVKGVTKKASGPPRARIQIKKIETARSRQATYTKRKTGLLKKAMELSTLCDIPVMVVLFDLQGARHLRSAPALIILTSQFDAETLRSGHPILEWGLRGDHDQVSRGNHEQKA